MLPPGLSLPIESAIPDLRRALAARSSAVLQAPPGAGKTTIVPLALRDEPWLGSQRIVVLEPRRIAARAAAHRMATLLGERVGDRVGYRVRADSRIGPRTRIEVVTEGVLTRQILDDPTLDGIGLVILDEFHERSLHADVALALTLHSHQLVRDELRVLVMSATLDARRVAALMGDAPVVTSEGRQFPVSTIYVPPRPGVPLAAGVAAVVELAVAEQPGDVLVFLPGQREIAAVNATLAEMPLPAATRVIPLHGQLPLEEQDRAIAPSPAGARKIVLSTSVAETSLTIEGIRVVIDAGLARVPRFSPAAGMSRLQTVRVSRAAADQRRGRAGRVAPGVCYRLWHQHETARLVPFATPELLEADLAPLALDLAMAGIGDPATLRWLDPPPGAALSQGRELLRELEAIDAAGRITAHGSRLARLGTHPRIAHMLCVAAERGSAALGADLAALLGDRDIMRGEGGPPPTDVRLRLDALRGHVPGTHSVDPRAVRRARDEAARWRRALSVAAGGEAAVDAGILLALAYPDRIAWRREGAAPRYAMRGGGGAILREDDPLAHEPVLAIAETDGRRPEARVLLAAPVDPSEILEAFASQIDSRDVVTWDAASCAPRAVREVRLGEIVLSRHALAELDESALAGALRRAVDKDGLDVLPWSDRATALRQRLRFLHAHDPRFPDVSDAALATSIDRWLMPALAGVRRVADVRKLELTAPLLSLLDWNLRLAVDALAPAHVEVPSGSRIPVDYGDPAAPVLAVRLQEMFGCQESPAVLAGRVPLTLHLLSPSHRPVQVTRDLRGFWQSSYFEVRKDLRGRYPRHSWPDDPLNAQPTRRAKPRQ